MCSSDLLVTGGVHLLHRVQAPHVVEADDRLGHGGAAAADPGGDIRHHSGLDIVRGPAAGLIALDEFSVGQVPLDVDDVDPVAAAPGERGEFAVALARGVGAVEQEGGALADPGGDGGLEVTTSMSSSPITSTTASSSSTTTRMGC